MPLTEVRLAAGLGIGGLAVALAARSTLENLFGAFSIAADQPFREGDFVKIDDFAGTVEAIGLRSTRIRTLDRTIITIPMASWPISGSSRLLRATASASPANWGSSITPLQRRLWP